MQPVPRREPQKSYCAKIVGTDAKFRLARQIVCSDRQVGKIKWQNLPVGMYELGQRGKREYRIVYCRPGANLKTVRLLRPQYAEETARRIQNFGCEGYRWLLLCFRRRAKDAREKTEQADTKKQSCEAEKTRIECCIEAQRQRLAEAKTEDEVKRLRDGLNNLTQQAQERARQLEDAQEEARKKAEEARAADEELTGAEA